MCRRVRRAAGLSRIRQDLAKIASARRRSLSSLREMERCCVLRGARMPPSPSGHASSRRICWALMIPAAAAFAYACAHLSWYRETPLGQVPVLDEQENLAFAEAIVRGALPNEPFYRAPGYALLLATLRIFGVPTEGLFHAALVLGTLLHAVGAFLVARITQSFFPGSRPALLAGLLYALNPVLVHYATQALDAVPALVLFLLGLSWLAPVLSRPASPSLTPENGRTGLSRWNVTSVARWGGASLSWAAASMFRPNYLLVWAVLPLLGIMYARRWHAAASVLVAGGAIFAAVAAWQWRVSGEARVLPWQGPYNLWAANQPGAHGRYFVQRHAVPSAVAVQNPARAESMYLYHQETGVPARDIDTVNAHWRGRFVDHVLHHPFEWLSQLAWKTYALLNNWEQYNNKTYAFHKARSPWLRWNPIGWGILLVLAVAGVARLRSELPAAATSLATLVAATVASIALFFVSARFRLPLVALAIIPAAGALATPAFWRAWTGGRRLALAGSMGIAAIVAFSRFDDVASRNTYVQDHALLARAAETVGNDALAWTEATAALELQPTHPDALRLAVASYFNQLVFGTPIPGAEQQWRTACARLLSASDSDVRDLQAVAALALWRGGEREPALDAWRNLRATPSALAARLLVDDVRLGQIDASVWRGAAWQEPLVRLAATRFNIAPPAGVSLGNAERAAELVQRLFALQPSLSQ